MQQISDKTMSDIKFRGATLGGAYGAIVASASFIFPIVGVGILGYRIGKNCVGIARTVSEATKSDTPAPPPKEKGSASPSPEKRFNIGDPIIRWTQKINDKVGSSLDWVEKKIDGNSHVHDSLTKFFTPSNKKPNTTRISRWGAAAGIASFAAAATLMVVSPPVGIAALGFMIAKDSIKLASIHTKTLTEALVKKSDRAAPTQSTTSKSNQKSLVKQALRAQDTLRNKEAYIQARSAKERQACEEAVASAKAAGKPLSATEVMALRNKEEKKRHEGYKQFRKKNQGR